MNKNNLPIYLSIAVIFGILIGIFFNGNSSNSFSLSKSSSNEIKIKRLINFIDKDYVDEVNTDKLLDDAITQMLSELDPHSVYIPKENLQAVTESMQGNFVGIGVQFRMEFGTYWWWFTGNSLNNQPRYHHQIQHHDPAAEH